MQKRLLSLLLKLTNINLAIESEQRRTRPDWMRLFRLKRLRLKFKDRMQGGLMMGQPALIPVLVPVRNTNYGRR